MPKPQKQSQPDNFMVVGFDDKIAIVKTKDGRTIRISRSPEIDQFLRIGVRPEIGQAEDIREVRPLTAQVGRATDIVPVPQDEVELMQRDAVRAAVPPSDDPRDKELESADEELRLLQEEFVRRFVPGAGAR